MAPEFFYAGYSIFSCFCYNGLRNLLRTPPDGGGGAPEERGYRR